MKYIKAAVVLTAMALTAANVTAFARAPYTDIRNTAAETAINYLYDTRCLTFTGTADIRLFHPEQTITRGELAQLLCDTMPVIRAADSAGTIENPIQEGAKAVSAMLRCGIMTNQGDGTFHPNDIVTREELAAAVYRYMAYYQMENADKAVGPFADEKEISAPYLPMVQSLHRQHIIGQQTDYFRPQQPVTRAEAVLLLFHLVKPDGTYISHVDVQKQVMKTVGTVYGSSLSYFDQGAMYWQGDTLVLALKGGTPLGLVRRLKDEIAPAGVVVLRRTKYSRSDYVRMMDTAVRIFVKAEGVQNYVGAEPDYAKEQIVLTVHYPANLKTTAAIADAVGNHTVRIDVLPTIAPHDAAGAQK
jgi:hypothetical protein